MIKFNRDNWELSGKMAEIKRLAYANKIPQSVYLLCWQICAYGQDYVNLLDHSVNLQSAIELLNS